MAYYNTWGGSAQPQMAPGSMPPSQPQMAPGSMPMPPQYSTANFIELHNPTMPFRYPIVNLSPGNMIHIKGRPNYGADRFLVNLNGLNGDVIFHFNPRFGEGQVVRNTMSGGCWGAEERVAPYFPFSPGMEFDIQIIVQQSDFMVSVNAQPFITYYHRMPYNYVTCLEVEGDVTLTTVSIN